MTRCLMETIYRTEKGCGRGWFYLTMVRYQGTTLYLGTQELADNMTRYGGLNTREPIPTTSNPTGRRPKEGAQDSTPKRLLDLQGRVQAARGHIGKRLAGYDSSAQLPAGLVCTGTGEHQTGRQPELAVLLHFRRLVLELRTNSQTRACLRCLSGRTGRLPSWPLPELDDGG